MILSFFLIHPNKGFIVTNKTPINNNLLTSDGLFPKHLKQSGNTEIIVKLKPTQQKIPGKKVLIYLLLILALILVMAGWNRIFLIFQTFFPLSN